MFEFSTILPFASFQFYYFFIVAVIIVFLSKVLFNNIIKLKYLILFINLSYIIFLFPKPIQLISLVYCLFHLTRFLKNLKINYLLAALLISLPLVIMKLIGIEFFNVANNKLAVIFQIVGISYITFRTIQIYVDEDYKEHPPKFIDFFNFTVFVPSLLIGPIDRFDRFTKEIENGFTQINTSNYAQAFNYLTKGIAYKYIIAELISRLILNHLDAHQTPYYHVIYMYSYLIFLFFDFAGYSLLAMSFAKFLGVTLPNNFDKPFLAVNPKEFWTKWHKSLGDWLNDYFFKPIFKELTSRKYFSPISRQNIALFSTFTLMGFWNGFELHFILSGMLFGIFSVIHNYYSFLCKKNKKDVLFGSLNSSIVSIISIVIMFNAVAFSIYIFSGKLI